MAPRVLKVGRGLSLPVHPSSSMLAGCMTSVSWAEALLFDMLNVAHCRWPGRVRQMVDDINQLVVGTAKYVIEQTVRTAVHLSEGFKELDLTVSPSKTIVLASSSSLVKDITKELKGLGIKVIDQTCARDLGVDTGAGRIRATGVLRSRLTAVKQRLKRIGVMARINKNARKLIKTGAWPACSYGANAFGIASGAMRTLRDQVARASGYYHEGGCITTTLAIALGQSNDPHTRHVLDKVTWWLKHWACNPKEHPALEKTWAKLLPKLAKNEPWACNYVKGPTGALIKALCELGWDPETPSKWVRPSSDPENPYVWQLEGLCTKDGGCLQAILADIEEDCNSQLWAKAALHRGGEGLQGGCDLTVIKKHLKLYEQTGDACKAGMLMTAATGALWPMARKCEVFTNQATPDCPRCGLKEDEFHRIWACTGNQQCTSQDNQGVIDSTEYLTASATEDRDGNLCFWTRGLVPSSWVQVPPPLADPPIWLIGGKCYEPGRYYTDGSGGKHTSDIRIRRCGFAIAKIVMYNGRWTLEQGCYGPLPGGRQTVPKAEMFALIALLQLALACHGPHWVPDEDYVCISDCQYLVNGFHNGRHQTSQGLNGDLWSRLWELVDLLHGKVKVHKVAAHCSASDIVNHHITLEDAIGNSTADALATIAAEQCQVDSSIVKTLHKLDELAWKVQRRIVACNLEACTPGQKIVKVAAGPSTKLQGLDRTEGLLCLLETNGHKLIKQKTTWQCVRCLGIKRHDELSGWMLSGACPNHVGHCQKEIPKAFAPYHGQEKFGVHYMSKVDAAGKAEVHAYHDCVDLALCDKPEETPARVEPEPQHIQPGLQQQHLQQQHVPEAEPVQGVQSPPVPIGFMLGKTILHSTHLLAQYRGVVWCWRCCCYSNGNSPKALAKTCSPNRYKAARDSLARLERGLPPGKGSWPLPVDDAAPLGLINANGFLYQC